MLPTTIYSVEELRVFLSKQLLEARKKTGLSQLEFGLLVNRSSSQVSRWENIANGKAVKTLPSNDSLLITLFGLNHKLIVKAEPKP
jgi:transcriptional regulator with XRE-family HTH domain